MDSVTFAWVITATVLGGVQLFFQRITAEERRSAALSGIFMYGLSGIMGVCLLPFVGIPPNAFHIIAFGLVAGVTHGIGNFTRIEALKYVDSVIYFPLNKVVGPLLVVIGGVFLFSEALSLREYIGIVFSLMVPLLLLSSVENSRQRDLKKGVLFMVISTALTAVSTLSTKEGLLMPADVIMMLVTTQFAATISSTALFLREKKMGIEIAPLDRRDVLLGFVLGILGFFSYFTMLRALSTGYVSLVYVIHAHYILIPIVLSVWWYGEHINVRKTAAIIVSFLAISLLY